MMRILLGIESYLPNISGVTVFTKRLATHLAESGHQVWIITTSPFGWAHEEKDPADFFIYRLRGWKNPFRRGLRVSSLRNRKEIRRLIGELQPDILHLQDPAIISGLLLREAKRKNIPVIFHHHFSMEFVYGYFKWFGFLKVFLRAFIEHRAHTLYNQAKLVITPTEFVKRVLMGWGIKTPIIAISNGIALDRFKPGKPDKAFYERFELAPEDKIALYLGRLDKDKNIRTLIKAIPRIVEKAPQMLFGAEVKFVFVGEGAERAKLEEEIRKKPWAQCVRFLGYIPHEDEIVPKIYQAADLYWTASTIETQSLTTLEAMATGLPVVAANFGALPEIVHENENGFLVDPYNVDGFVAAVLDLFSDPTKAKAFGRRSIEIAAGHDVERSFKKFIATYIDIIDIARGSKKISSS
jgi:glycosyltransferase involved in cell wall biosynthesis